MRDTFYSETKQYELFRLLITLVRLESGCD